MPECPCGPDRNDDAGRGIRNDAPVRDREEQPAAPARCCRAWWKVAVVVALVAAVAGIIASKTHRGASPSQEPDRSDVGPQGSSPIQPASGPEVPAEAEMVLATVNGEPITLADLEEALRALPDQYRSMFARSKHELLEQLIVRELLLQHARELGPGTGAPPNPAPGQNSSQTDQEEALIDAVLQREAFDKVRVTDKELRAFYEEHRDEIPADRAFDQVREALRPYVEQEMRQQAVEELIAHLNQKAEISRNEAWVEKQKALAADNPLDRALQSGRPVVADFGRGTCIPCKMMKPILDELKEGYAGRAEVLIINVDDYAAVTQRVGIRAIPTQIFYDASGREVHRHEGFMPREDIVAKLAEMGVR